MSCPPWCQFDRDDGVHIALLDTFTFTDDNGPQPLSAYRAQGPGDSLESFVVTFNGGELMVPADCDLVGALGLMFSRHARKLPHLGGRLSAP